MQLGTGGPVALTRLALDALDGERLRLRWFLAERTAPEAVRAESALGERAASVEVVTLDAGRPVAGQGFEPHSVDVLVAVDALRRSGSVRAALATCRELLKPGGLLVVAEADAGDLHLLTSALDPAGEPVPPAGGSRCREEELRAAGFDVVAVDATDGGDPGGRRWTVLLAEPCARPAALAAPALLPAEPPAELPAELSGHELNGLTVGGLR